MEQLITQTKKQFDDILTYVQGDAQGQQLREVEKGIFRALLKLGLGLLLVFLQQKGIGNKGKIHTDKDGIKRPYHSVKCRRYLSIFGKLGISRACYWAKGSHEIYPLDAELNLPDTEYSYLLQEWSVTLGSEESYEKTAHFLEGMLGISLWGSSIETIVQKTFVNVPKFYEERQSPEISTEKKILVATVDGKGVVMRKDQVKIRIRKKRRMKKTKERERRKKMIKKGGQKIGKKKMSTVIGVYTIDPQERTPAEFLTRGKKKETSPRPCNKVIQATLQGKESGFQRLKKEVEKRDPKREKNAVALVDGEHKLRELIKEYLPWFLIIIDIYHVMEHLWRGAYIFHREGSQEAADWMTDKLNKLLLGQVKEVILDLKDISLLLSKGRKIRLNKLITYLDNGKEHMRYDIYLKAGYPVGSGVVEGACKNLVKDRMEQSGMHWTIGGAEALLSTRSIQLNKMTDDYWTYHTAAERKRLYGGLIDDEALKWVA